MVVQQFDLLLGLLGLLVRLNGMNLILKIPKTFELYWLVILGIILSQIYIYLNNCCCKMCKKDSINLHIYSILDISNNRLNIISMIYRSSKASRVPFY
jgi:hypothetical protein